MVICHIKSREAHQSAGKHSLGQNRGCHPPTHTMQTSQLFYYSWSRRGPQTANPMAPAYFFLIQLSVCSSGLWSSDLPPTLLPLLPVECYFLLQVLATKSSVKMMGHFSCVGPWLFSWEHRPRASRTPLLSGKSGGRAGEGRPSQLPF